MLQPEFSCFCSSHLKTPNISVTKASLCRRFPVGTTAKWGPWIDHAWKSFGAGLKVIWRWFSNVTCIVCLHSPTRFLAIFGCLGLLWYALQKKKSDRYLPCHVRWPKNCHWFSPVLNSAAWPAQSVTRKQGPERKEPGRLKCYVLEQVSKSTEEMDGCVWK